VAVVARDARIRSLLSGPEVAPEKSYGRGVFHLRRHHIPSNIPIPMSSIVKFLRSESGATTAEYGIIIVVVAGIAIFVLSQLNGALSTLYDKFNGKVSTVS
jgi:Flp pilus assembly pilin Flp